MRRIVLLVLANLLAFALLRSTASSAHSFTHTQAAVRSQIDAVRCSSSELAVRDIGWARDLNTAFPLARASGRPVFVVTGDGDLCTGRV